MLLEVGSSLIINCVSAGSIDTYVEYIDYIPATSFTPVAVRANVAASGNTTLLAAPGAGTDRKIKNVVINNKNTTANTIYILNGTSRVTASVALQVGDNMSMDANDTWTVMDSSGRVKVATPDVTAVNGQTLCFRKVQLAVGTAIGTPHFLGTSTGTPNAWAIGAPGMNGRVVTSESGGLTLPTTSGNNNYLSQIQGATTVAQNFQWMDLCWVNQITTLNSIAAQAIVTPAFPARDINGSALGAGYCLGLLILTATPATASTITVTYVSNTGAASTATVAHPAVIQTANTILPFSLGITGTGGGIQSISQIQLSVAIATGTAALIVYRCLPGMAMQVANLSYINQIPDNGVKLFSGATLLPYNNCPTATTALTVSGDVVITQK